MHSLMISRRTLLASASALLAASTVLGRAEVLSIIEASAAVIDNLCKFQRRAGSLPYQIEVLHVTLDQMLQNQKALLDGVSASDNSVQMVLHATSMMPEPAVAGPHIRDAQRVYDKLADRLRELDGNSSDGAAREGLARLFQEANDVATNLRNGTAVPSGSTELALACEMLKTILIALSSQDYVAGDRERASLASTSGYLVEVYTSLLHDRATLAWNMQPVRSGLQNVVALIDQHPLRRVLPPDFSAILDTSSITETRRTSVCLKTGITRNEIDRDRIWRDVQNENGKSLEQVGERVTTDETTRLTFPQFKLDGVRIRGQSRYCYSIRLDEPSSFRKRSWTRRVVRTSMFNRTEERVENSDATEIIGPCMELKVDKTSVPRMDFESLIALVADYDALVAVESRIVGLQSVCIASKDEVSKLKEELEP